MSQLSTQLLLGGMLIVLATALQAFGIALAMMARPGLARWLGRRGLLKMIMVISLGALWMLTWQMAGVWLWAGLLIAVGAFVTLEPSLYFSLVSYTTLGFGDLLLPQEWRVLGGLIGAHGMLAFGVGTAALVAFVQGVHGDLQGGDDTS